STSWANTVPDMARVNAVTAALRTSAELSVDWLAADTALDSERKVLKVRKDFLFTICPLIFVQNRSIIWVVLSHFPACCRLVWLYRFGDPIRLYRIPHLPFVCLRKLFVQRWQNQIRPGPKVSRGRT